MADYLITTILAAEPPIPLVIGLASPDAKLSDQTMKLIESSGRAITSSWVPQKFLLNHDVTGFFVVRVVTLVDSILTPVDPCRFR